MSVDPAVALFLRLLLAGIFALAAFSKLRQREVFEGIVADYRILPAALVAPFARVLPFVELAAAALVLVPATVAAGAVLAALLLAAFAAAMAVNILRGRTDIDCGCFLGALPRRIGWPLVVRNLLLVLGSLALLLPVAPRALVWLDAVSVAGALVVVGASYAATSRMFELAWPGERG